MWAAFTAARSLPKPDLIEPLVLFLLIADVLPDGLLISTHRGDEVPPRPEALAHEVALALPIHPRQMNGALSLHEPHHLRYRVLRRYRQQHVYVIDHQVAFFNSAFLLTGQLTEHFAQVFAQVHVQRAPAALRDEDHVVFAVPFAMAQTFKLVHCFDFLSCAWRLTFESLCDGHPLISQTSTASPAEPGVLPN